MTMVLLVWLLQLGTLAYFAMRDSGGFGLGERLLRIVRSPAIIGLGLGCVGFVVAGGHAARNYDLVGVSAAGVSFWLQLGLLVLVAIGLFFARFAGFGGVDMTFGSARFATAAHAAAKGLIGDTGIRLGRLRDPELAARGPDQPPLPLHYTGERHLLTVAPTRSGKGVSTIIPNLLTYPGSVLVCDPKGENAMATYERRSKIGRCFVLDPWGITSKPVACFNPLDLLKADSSTLIEDATLIAEALIVPETGGNAQHFSEQASDLVKGILLYLATTAGETPTLGQLRAILTGPSTDLTKLAIAMSKSKHPVIAAAASQIAAKNEKEWQSIVSTAQRNTHFLDSPALQKNLAASDFRFADLKGDSPVSIYLVLPVDRLTSHSRWLRMIIALAIAELARTLQKPKRPVYFVLDEMAAIGRLPIIEDAFGLMAGMGLMLHAIFQDLSQAKRVYGEGWQTFVGNAGAIQLFGTRDLMTAEYFSSLIGTTTRIARSTSSSSGSTSGSGMQPGSTNSGSSVSYAPTGRPLLFPDELMRMDAGTQIVLIENADPCLSEKIVWHREPAYVALAGGSANALPR